MIGNKSFAIAFQRRLDHRMTSALDIEFQPCADLGPDMAEIIGKLGKRRRDINHSQGIGRAFDGFHLRDDAACQIVEQVEFKA